MTIDIDTSSRNDYAISIIRMEVGVEPAVRFTLDPFALIGASRVIDIDEMLSFRLDGEDRIRAYGYIIVNFAHWMRDSGMPMLYHEMRDIADWNDVLIKIQDAEGRFTRGE